LGFSTEEFLPATLLAKVTDVRVGDPERSLRAAKERKRRASLTKDGMLNILAADHPARRVTRVGARRQRAVVHACITPGAFGAEARP